MTATSGQTARILSHLKARAGTFVPMPELSRIGSGKESGWCASFTKRLWECRQIAEKEGATIFKFEKRESGVRHTAYAYQKPTQAEPI